MCGIAGVVGRQSPDVRPALERMQAALRHRGPDDQGVWWSASGATAMAHTRLAVIELGPAGHQPMSSPDGRLTIAFSGEIYNFAQLRRELQQRGSVFHTQSDTEVILRGFEVFGVDVLPRLRGMFAFALWDERERCCLLARDPFGLKPLYYHRADDGALIFASEVRALLTSRLVPRDLDSQGVYAYLRAGTAQEPRTLIRDVSALEAGHALTWRAGAVTLTRFWTPCFPEVDAPNNHHVETVRRALSDSVAHHFVSDVPVAILLSGGVDSAAILALATETGRAGVRTLSMTLPGSAADEGAEARQTARRFGSSHSECAVDARTAKDLFPQYLAGIDQPSIDGFNTFVVARLARDHGVKVVLSGVGADELFGGYRSFTQVPRIAAWNKQLAWAGPLRNLGGKLLEQFACDARWRRVGDLLQQPPTLANTYATFRGIFTRRESRQLMSSFGLDLDPDHDCDVDAARELDPASPPTVSNEISRLELTRYVRNQLVRDSDTASMANGVELRAPFLDATLFDLIAPIPAAVRLASAKQLLRDAVQELPPWVSGPKRCFQFPFADWIEGEWQPVFAGVDVRSPVATETWYRKVCLYVLDHWIDRVKRDGC